MLIFARIVQGFLVFCLVIMAQIAAQDSQHVHAASVFILSMMLLALLGLATLAARYIDNEK